MMKESFIKCDTHPELMLPNAHRVSLSLLQVKNGDTHPPEDRDPLVPLDLVVGEAVDFVIHLALVEGGNREHVGAPSLQPHGKILNRHLGHHHSAPVALSDAEREHAVLHVAHGAHGPCVVGRRLQREAASHLTVGWPVLHFAPLGRRALAGDALVLSRCRGPAFGGLGAWNVVTSKKS